MLSLQTFLSRLIWLCVLPLVLLAAYLAIDHVRIVQARLEREATNQARNFSTAIDNQLRAQIAALQVLAASPLIDDPPRFREFYTEALGFRENFGGHVLLADTSMQMLLNTRVPLGTALPKIPRPRGQAAAPTALETGKPAVGDIVHGPVAQELLVAVVVPVFRNDRIRYLLLSTIETRKLQRQLDALAIPGERSVILLDGNGEAIARRTPPDLKVRPGSQPAEGRFAVNSTVSRWSVVLEVPPGVYRAPVIAAALALGVSILLATLIGVVGGRLASRGLARSVATLAHTSSPPQSSRPAIVEIDAVRKRLADTDAARTAAEAMRRESDARYRRIIETTLEGVLTMDADFRITYVNQRMLDMLGRREEEMLGQTPFIFLDEESRALATESAKRRKEGQAEQLELRFLRHDGSALWVLLNATPIIGADGHFAGATGMVTDITERKRAEEALRETGRRLSTLIANLPGVAYRCRNDANYTTEYVSESIAQMTGYPAEDFREHRRHFGDMIHTDDRDRVWTEIQIALQAQQSFELVYRIVTAAGTEKWVWEKGRGIRDAAGEVLTLEGFVTDITERRQAEEKLREQLDELQRWHDAVLGREDRVQELKREVNELLQQQRKPARYESFP